MNVTVLGRANINEWMGNKTAQIIIENYEIKKILLMNLRRIYERKKKKVKQKKKINWKSIFGIVYILVIFAVAFAATKYEKILATVN